MKKFKDIQVLILAGGFGTRFGNLTKKIPKPMIFIKKKPIIDHIIGIYERFGLRKFLILTGYKSSIIEKHFKNKKNIKVINTGLDTLTGSRIKKVEKYLDEVFFLTYGDGLASVNIKKLYGHHIKSKKKITMTAVHPPSRFGELYVKGSKLISFDEKPQMADGWINGGFFVINKDFLKNIPENKNVMLEREPFKKALRLKQFNIYKHPNFWRCLDNQRDVDELSKILKTKSKLPW